jgi:chemotaxis protein CheD
MAGPQQSEEKIIVGIGEYRVGSTPLTSIGLGSCIALVLHDERQQIGGMAHVMLPRANGKQDRPGKYADTAFCTLLEELRARGCRNGSVVAKIAGGAAMFKDFSGNLNIGERNIETIRSLASAHHVKVRSEDVGGNSGRSLTYYPADGGRVTIRRADGTCYEI